MLFGHPMAIGYQALQLAPRNYEQNTRKNRGKRVLEIKDLETNERGTENEKNTNGSSFWTTVSVFIVHFRSHHELLCLSQLSETALRLC